jgi:hypothetical protein
VLLLALVAPALLASQQPRDGATVATTIGTAAISGTVVTDDTTPTPVRRATVTLSGDLGATRLTASTDDAGRFSFTSLPADRYSVSVSKGGYLTSAYGSKRPAGSGTPIVAADGQRVAGITIKILKGSVLTGTVLDEHGRPASDVTVTALNYSRSFWTGERVLQGASDDSGQVTDERGMYRIYGLAPGEYVVSASPSLQREATYRVKADIHQVTEADVQRAQQLLRESAGATTTAAAQSGAARPGGSTVDYAPVYHPSAVSPADAVTIALGPREEHPGVDVLLHLVPTANIEGVVSGPDGKPLAGASLTVMDPGPQAANVFGSSYRNARTDPQGKFLLPSITPGRYTIIAEAFPGGNVASALSGIAEVSVEGRDVTTSMTLAPSLPMSGRLVFEGVLPRPEDLTSVLPMMTAAREGPSMFGLLEQVKPDGTFVYRVSPGAYRIRGIGRRPWTFVPSTGWMLRSITINGTDVTDSWFDIKPNDKLDGVVVTYTDQHTEISGKLLDAAGKPAPEYVLIAFPADKRLWLPLTRRTQQVRPGADGRFIIRNLPAGDYLIGALTDVEEGEWNDPAFLADLAAQAPIKITLADGEKKVQDIRVGKSGLYRTTTIGALQNAARSPDGSSTVTWQSYAPGSRPPSGIVNRIGTAFNLGSHSVRPSGSVSKTFAPSR